MTELPTEFLPIVIGEPPEIAPYGWAWVKLTKIAVLESGHTPKKSVPEFWENGNIPWISLKDIRAVHGKTIFETELCTTELGIDNSSARILPAGTVCFSRDISVGFVTIMGHEMATSQHFANWVCEDALLNHFLMLAFVAAQKSLIQSGEGTTVRTIYMPALRQTHVCLPPLAEQRRIVSKIESLQDRSLRARRACSEVASLLGQFRMSVLRAAFSGRLTADWRAVERDVEPATEILSRNHEYDDETKKRRRIKKKESVPIPDHLFHELPETWAYATVEDCLSKGLLIDFVDGNHGALYPRKADFGEEGIAFITAKQINDGVVDFDSAPRLNFEKAKKLQKGWAKGGDVLLTHNATVGRTARTPTDIGTFLIGTSATYYRCNHDALDRDYLFHVLSAPQWQGQLESIMEQTTRDQVSIQKQAFLRLPIAPLEEQREIARLLDKFMGWIQAVEESVAESDSTLTHLDQSILGKAFRGALVPQFPQDGTVVAAIRRVEKFRKNRIPSIRDRTHKVKKLVDAKSQLLAWLTENKIQSFSFDDIRTDVRANYDELRDALFELLTDKESGLSQYFDEAERTIRFKKVST